jgi:hypothetical protein
MIADKLMGTGFTPVILFTIAFLPVFLYFCALAIGAT